MTEDDVYKRAIACLAGAIMSDAHSHADLVLLIEMLGLAAKSETETETVIDQIISNNADKVKQYQSGKTQLLGFFVGQVMKATGGTANPVMVNDLLKVKLSV